MKFVGFLATLLFFQLVPSNSFKLRSPIELFNNIQWPKHLWSGPMLTRTAKRNFKLLFVLGLVGVESVSEIYVRLPQEIIYGSKPTPLEYSSARKVSENMVIIFPGAGGPDTYTDLLRQKISNSDRKAGVRRYVTVYDWLQWRGPFIRAAFDSITVGRQIGNQIATEDIEAMRSEAQSNNEVTLENLSPIITGKVYDRKRLGDSSTKLKNLQIVGISVGAFAADACAKSYKSAMMQFDVKPAEIQLTLLDPFTSKVRYELDYNFAY